MPNPEPSERRRVTGMELRLARVALGVSIMDLARKAGVSRQSVTYWEQRAVVPEERAAQYYNALATFGDVTASTDAA